MDDDCPANSEVIGDTREQAISAWNQRTPAASPVAPPESDEERDGNECARCFATIGTPYGLEPTEVCNLCAQEERLELKQKLAKLASPVAGGSARIAEIASRLAAAPPTPWRTELVPEGKIGSHTVYAEHEYVADCGFYGSAKDCAAFIAAAPDDIAYLLKLVPEGWVKVTPETMPRGGVRVLIHTRGGMILAGERDSDMQGSLWYADNDILGTGDITHWRKLPAPPAAEEERSSL